MECLAVFIALRTMGNACQSNVALTFRGAFRTFIVLVILLDE